MPAAMGNEERESLAAEIGRHFALFAGRQIAAVVEHNKRQIFWAGGDGAALREIEVAFQDRQAATEDVAVIGVNNTGTSPRVES
jgi:hypothetical protein